MNSTTKNVLIRSWGIFSISDVTPLHVFIVIALPTMLLIGSFRSLQG